MTAMTNDEYADAVMRMAEPVSPFVPTATYIPEGDCVEFVAAPDDYRAHRIDGLVTVYYSRKTNQIIGSLIKGIHAFCQKVLEKCPGFKIALESGPVKLEHIFLAKLWTQPNPQEVIVVRAYKELIEVAEENDIQFEIGQSA